MFFSYNWLFNIDVHLQFFKKIQTDYPEQKNPGALYQSAM